MDIEQSFKEIQHIADLCVNGLREPTNPDVQYEEVCIPAFAYISRRATQMFYAHMDPEGHLLFGPSVEAIMRIKDLAVCGLNWPQIPEMEHYTLAIHQRAMLAIMCIADLGIVATTWEQRQRAAVPRPTEQPGEERGENSDAVGQEDTGEETVNAAQAER